MLPLLNTFMTTDAWVSPDVLAMLGEPKHIVQARVYVAAKSKAAAERFVADLPQVGGGRLLSAHARYLGTAMGIDFDSMDEAGLFDQPCVVVVSRTRSNSRVVRIDAHGARVVGDLVAGRYVPAGTLNLTLQPAAARALRELLACVPDEADTRELWDLLPPELRNPG